MIAATIGVLDDVIEPGDITFTGPVPHLCDEWGNRGYHFLIRGVVRGEVVRWRAGEWEASYFDPYSASGVNRTRCLAVMDLLEGK